MTAEKILILQPPNPPHLNILRDYAGGYGVAVRSRRPDGKRDEGSVPYVSSLYAGAILENMGYDVSIVDCQAEQLTPEECLSKIREIGPGIVVSTVNLPSLNLDLIFLAMLKEMLASVEIIAVGTTCKLLYDQILKEGCVKAAVRGDAEVVVPRLVPAMLEGEDLSSVPGIAFSPQPSETHVTGNTEPSKDLNWLPMLPYHKLVVERYREPSWGQETSYMPVLDARGCPFQCRRFCPYPFGFGRKPVYRDPELVVDEVQYLHENYATKAFNFRNQNFTMNRSHAEGICREIIRRGLKIRWLCEARLDAVDPEILKLMKSAGCELVHYGLESGDPELFNAVGKPGCDLASHGRAVEETKRAGMMPKLNVTIGLPGESWQSLRQTVRTIKYLKPDVVMATIITPYPGTELYDNAKEQGLLLTDDWSEFTGFDPVMRTEHLTPKELLKAQKMVNGCINRKPVLPVRVMRKVLRRLQVTGC